MTTRDDSPSRRRTDFETPPRDDRLKILAVDDDPAYLRYLKLVLTRSGFDVELAPDGGAALMLLRSGLRADLLLIDLAMPGLDGIETVRQLQSERATSLYTILLTARDAVETKLRALNSGFDDFLSKTSSESEIIAKIRSAARRLELERRLHTLANTDELTGIANRRALFVAANDLFRAGRRTAVVLLDLDQFKKINDTHGHVAGDRILTQVASVLQETTRFGDIVGRYGGDEFLVLLPDATLEEALQIVERIRGKLPTPAQFGIALATSSLSDAIAVCDQAMYREKGLRRQASAVRTTPEA